MVPKFLCIGAPKAGTTWLSTQLQGQPNIWIPPIKELHYFDKCFPITVVGQKRGIKHGLLGLYPTTNRKTILRVFGKAIKRRSLQDLLWANRYFGGGGSDEWYFSLFENAGDKICGELTTDYCALSSRAVEHISTILPDLKLIFLLRNPIERAWSHARMLLPELLDKRLADITQEEFLSYMCHPAAKQKGEYSKALDRWQGHFPRKNIFIGFYDDIVSSPEDLLRQILLFLEVDTEAPVYEGIHQRVNVGKGSSKMPSGILAMMQVEYQHEIEALSKRFGGHASGWLNSLTGC